MYKAFWNMDRLVEFHKITKRGVLMDGIPRNTKRKRERERLRETERKRFIIPGCNTYCFNFGARKVGFIN